MERWLAHELCFHRDPSLVRFYTGAGPRGLFDLSGNRRHLTVETNGLSDGFAGIANSNKHGLTFAPHNWGQAGSGVYRTMTQRYFDPKSSAVNNQDISFGVNDEFTILCWVRGNNISNLGPLLSCQGVFKYADSEPNEGPYGTRGWEFGCIGNAPYLQMYSHDIPGLIHANNSDSWGNMLYYGELDQYTNVGIQQWTQIAVVFRGSAIPWGRSYLFGGDQPPNASDPNEYYEGIGTTPPPREFISFYRNGRNIKGENSAASAILLKKTSQFTTGQVGEVWPDDSIIPGMVVIEEPTLNMGASVTTRPSDVLNLEKTYQHSTAPACMFRIYNRALGDNEITEIYRREQFNNFYKPFQAIGVVDEQSFSCYLSGIGATQGSFTVCATSSDSKSSSFPVFAIGNEQTVKAYEMSLFVAVDEAPKVDVSLPLFLLGSENDGMMHTFPIYAFTGDDGQTRNLSVPIFAKAVDKSSVSKIINLYTSGCGNPIAADFDIMVWNDQLGIASSFPLFVRGDGVTDGAVPLAMDFNLFFKRDPSVTIPLYVHGTGQAIGQELTLYTLGSDGAFIPVNLSVPNVVGASSLSLKLYTTGF